MMSPSSSARMMQPARHSDAMVSSFRSQPYSLPARVSRSMPCAYATSLEAKSARRTSSTNSGSPAPIPVVAIRPAGSSRCACSRCSRSEEERARANTDSAIAETGEPRSRPALAVHRPVPFWPAASTITSTRGLPVFASTCASTSAVISIR